MGMLPAIAALTVCWLALSRSLDPTEALAGVGAAAVAVFLQRLIFRDGNPFVAGILRRPIALLRFLLTLAVRLAVSTFHTSWLILSGRGEGRFMALPLGVRDPLGQFVLLNSVTLTPSTISLLVEEDVVYLHWLQPRGGSGDWQSIKESIERRVLDLFPRSEP
jgi:multisubunit Na+/H+ antiporter MnhE subunit